MRINPGWASKIAGFPYYGTFGQHHPESGYGLLVHLAGQTGKKQLAVQYIKRMIELNSEYPGDANARQAARDAKVVDEVKKIADVLGVSWHWWE